MTGGSATRQITSAGNPQSAFNRRKGLFTRPGGIARQDEQVGGRLLSQLVSRSGAMRLTTGPRTANHFWPRLWKSARPLGGEARKEMSKGRLPIRESIADDVDSRVFVQGGQWIAKHTALLTAVATSPDSATCVLVWEGSHLYSQACPKGRSLKPRSVQGLLQLLDADRLECSVALCFGNESGASNSKHIDDRVTRASGKDYTQHVIKANLADEDIWWCLPFWAAADYKLHSEKIPVEKGFYFLVEPARAFCIAVLNWTSTKFIVRAQVDGRWVSRDG